jgi:hypothetical protein
MSLGPFPILLIPSTKNGKLQFWNDLTQQIIEADFSRPNVGDTSGAGVWRKGVFIELAENEPDWDDSSGCPVIKMRPQAENLISFTETFSGGNWVNSGSPSLTQNQISPRGSLDAWSYDSANGTVRAGNSVTLSATASENFYTHGLYVKKIVGGATQARLQNNRSNGGAVYADFNLDNGTIITVSSGTARIEEIYNGNGWYRISLTSEVLATGSFSLILATQDATNKNYAIAGASLIAGANDYSYIPRLTSAAAIRAANMFTSLDLVSQGLIGATEGTVFLHIKSPAGVRANNSSMFSLGNSNNLFSLYRNNASASRFRAYIASSGGNYNTGDFITDEVKLCWTWKSGQILLSINGATALNLPESLDFTANSNLYFNGGVLSTDILQNSYAPISMTEAEINAETTL